MGARDLLADLTDAGFTVMADGDRLVIRPASLLSDKQRDALRQAKAELLALVAHQSAAQAAAPDLAAVAWTDADMAHYLARRARLLRWGWAEREAEALAERLVIRDRERDARVSCADCQHGRPGRCGNHRRAGLSTGELCRGLVATLQRCPGFAPVMASNGHPAPAAPLSAP